MIQLVCPVHRVPLSSDLKCPEGHGYQLVDGIPDLVGKPAASDFLERIAPLYEGLWAPLGFLITARKRYSVLLKEAGSFSGADSFLDVGTGTGKIFDFVDCTDCVGLDISLRFLKILKTKRGKVRAVRGDATSLPFPDESFKGVSSIFVLHMLNDPERGIAEISRVLARGGKCSVGVLVKGGFISSLLSSWWKLKLRNQDYYENSIRSHGLRIHEAKRMGPWFLLKCQKV